MPYPDGRAVEQAIQAAARKDVLWPAGKRIPNRLDELWRDRALSRIFSTGEKSGWLLKGGSGILARIPAARWTTDVDLHRSDVALDDAEADIRRQLGQDLGDHVRFTPRTQKPIVGQEGVAGRRLVFEVNVGGKRFSTLKLDIVTARPPVGTVTVLEPSNVPRLDRLVSHPYRLYPIADQVADKLCAIHMVRPGGRVSSREKDLVDLLIITKTQELDADELRLAIATAAHRLGQDPIARLDPPDSWGKLYRAEASKSPLVADTDLQEAVRNVSEVLDPVLTGNVRGRFIPGEGWSTPAAVTNADAPSLAREPIAESNTAGADGAVWVRPHERNGHHIEGHWRRPSR